MACAGILLDLDGTLADTSEVMACALERALAVAGVAVPASKRLRERVRREGPRAICRGFGVTSLGEYWSAYQRFVGLCSPCAPGLPEAFAKLKSADRVAGVVTSLPQPAAFAVLRALGVLPHVTTVVTYGTTLRHKPAPDPVLAGARGLGLTPAECLYAGDTPDDVLAGRAAGVCTAAVLWGFGMEAELLGSRPDLVFRRPADMLAYLLDFSG